ncbi:MAG: ATP-binding protein, partial [Bacteroidota bacterium]
MHKGKIDVSTENIFPIIKKFLYSEHEIFLREIVSNAVDATQKLKTLARLGEYKDELGDLTIRISIDKKKKALVISDRGIGMTGEEIDKYINQIAFSSAEEFLEKYKNKTDAIIGHFGLGFYSAFMVSEKVEIVTKSHKPDSKAMKWSCDGTPEYALEETNKDDRGTDIYLYLDKDSQEFLEEKRVEEILKRYCRYLPVEIAFGKEKEWKDGKEVETGKDRVINDPNPLWTKMPADLKEEDYQNFYRDLYPMQEDPLFNIHINVDYP